MYIPRYVTLNDSLVVYRDGKERFVSNPTEFPDTGDATSKVVEIQEPIVKATIIVPEGMYLCLEHNHSLPNSSHSMCYRILRSHDGPVLFAQS